MKLLTNEQLDNIKARSDGPYPELHRRDILLRLIEDIKELQSHKEALISALAYALATSKLSVSHVAEILCHVNGYEGSPNVEDEIMTVVAHIRDELGINPKEQDDES